MVRDGGGGAVAQRVAGKRKFHDIAEEQRNAVEEAKKRIVETQKARYDAATPDYRAKVEALLEKIETVASSAIAEIRQLTKERSDIRDDLCEQVANSAAAIIPQTVTRDQWNNAYHREDLRAKLECANLSVAQLLQSIADYAAATSEEQKKALNKEFFDIGHYHIERFGDRFVVWVPDGSFARFVPKKTLEELATITKEQDLQLITRRISEMNDSSNARIHLYAALEPLVCTKDISKRLEIVGNAIMSTHDLLKD